jgi:tetratricopeptide (TPR) repeat protein
VIDDLVPRFEILTDMIMQLSPSKTPDKPQEDTQSYSTISVPQRPPSLTNLVFSAKDVLDQARYTIEQSEEGSDDSSTITVMLHHLDLLEQDLQSNLAMHSGGQWSRPRTEPGHHEFVQNWVSSAPMGANTGRSDSASVPTRTQMTPSQSSIETSTIGGDSPSFDENSDEDDDLDYEILQEFLKRGFANYEKGDWANAELYIRRAIDSSKTLPLDKVRLKGIDLEAAQFQIAICAFHQKRFDEADVETLELRTARPASNEPRNTTLRRILSVYLFAEICFEKKKLEEAHKCCRKALSMRRKLLGETVWLETNCFALLSAIATAQGDNLTAEVYQDKARASITPDTALEQEQEQESEIRSARLDRIRTCDRKPRPYRLRPPRRKAEHDEAGMLPVIYIYLNGSAIGFANCNASEDIL